MTPPLAAATPSSLRRFNVDLHQCSVSGLSSGAFMAVQLQLAHSALFVGAGVIAGGPCRCVESFPGTQALKADAFVQNALFICMNPLTPAAGPDPARLAALAREAAACGRIDALAHLARQRLYLFTGTRDSVVHPSVVQATRAFYQLLGVPESHIHFVDRVPAGHAILSTHPEDNPLGANQPPYINHDPRPGARMQSHDILEHLLGPLAPPATRLGGELLRFDQTEFFGGQARASMSRWGYAYVPAEVLDGAPARVHVALHGCKQGSQYVDFVNGRPDRSNNPPYGLRYVTGTGYNELAETNRLIVLYPQAEGTDTVRVQNPEGCWDWWGYSAEDPAAPDYWSQQAIQIRAIHAMLMRLGGQ